MYHGVKECKFDMALFLISSYGLSSAAQILLVQTTTTTLLCLSQACITNVIILTTIGLS